jgi:hypothetical protein
MITGYPLAVVVALSRHFGRAASLALICAFIFLSCNSPLSEREYAHWIRDYSNGLHVRETIDGFVFDVQYQPSEYLFIANADRNSNTAVVAGAADAATIQQYVLTIATSNEGEDFISAGVSDVAEKQQKLYYFSYQFQNDITLEENGKVLGCVLYHFELSSHRRGERAIVLGFEQQKTPGDNVQLVIRSQYFGSLPIRINISKKNIPAIQL